jgi:hypothetical protein
VEESFVAANLEKDRYNTDLKDVIDRIKYTAAQGFGGALPSSSMRWSILV